METIALFGGSFDPPHIGHEAIVKELLKLKEIDKVVIMPTFLNPFKQSFIAPSTLRLEWLKKIFASYKNVEVSDYEVDLKTKVPTIDSVKHLLKRYEKVYLTLGADNLKTLHRWYKYDELANLVTFVIASRENIEIPKKYIKITVEEDISSTKLRVNIDSEKLSPVCSDEITKFYKEYNDKNQNSIFGD